MSPHHTRNTRLRSSAALRAAAYLGLLCLSLLGGCGSLLPKPAAQPSLFALDDAAPVAHAARLAPPPAAAAPTLIVNAPRAAAGFDTAHIVYVRQAHEIEYFAHSLWVDTPAQMLAPLIVHAIERKGAFRAVLRGPSGVAGELRLDTEIIRLQHEFTGGTSRVRLTLRAALVETASRRVVAWREFDAIQPSASDDPYGGVAAANQAVQSVLSELATFCAEFAVR